MEKKLYLEEKHSEEVIKRAKSSVWKKNCVNRKFGVFRVDRKVCLGVSNEELLLKTSHKINQNLFSSYSTTPFCFNRILACCEHFRTRENHVRGE